MADRFPDQVAETIGRFQVVSRSPTDGGTGQVDLPRRSGVLRFQDNSVELEVSPGFNPVLPGCVGRVNRWKRAVTDQRNALAHGLPPQGSGIDLTKMHAMSRSLRWVLTVYLLLEAGAPAGHLAESTQANERYERDWRNWRRVWSRVSADSI